ncbi:hypothetical protein DP42_5847 [Burkholderia pseudomallei]|nr:hypothetical protein DP42_5847 [Burkholderia pseudomallei]
MGRGFVQLAAGRVGDDSGRRHRQHGKQRDHENRGEREAVCADERPPTGGGGRGRHRADLGGGRRPPALFVGRFLHGIVPECRCMRRSCSKGYAGGRRAARRRGRRGRLVGISGSAVQRFSGSAVQRFSGSAVQRFDGLIGLPDHPLSAIGRWLSAVDIDTDIDIATASAVTRARPSRHVTPRRDHASPMVTAGIGLDHLARNGDGHSPPARVDRSRRAPPTPPRFARTRRHGRTSAPNPAPPRRHGDPANERRAALPLVDPRAARSHPSARPLPPRRGEPRLSPLAPLASRALHHAETAAGGGSLPRL